MLNAYQRRNLWAARRATALAGLVGVGALAAFAAAAMAERIENPAAEFAALDKVTARIQALDVKLGTTREFGSLLVTPRVCYSRPPTEPPKTTAFVEVDEVKLDGSKERIFSGWMFAESPGLHAVEHPVFDIWLTSCVAAKPAAAAEGEAAAGDDAADGEGEQPAEAAPKKKRRVKR